MRFINEFGLRMLAGELNCRHKKFSKVPLDPTVPSDRKMLYAWAAYAEQNLMDGSLPQIEIPSHDAMSGHTELVRLDEKYFDDVT